MALEKPHPPTYFIIILILQIALHFVFPIVQLYNSPLRWLGIALIVFGSWLNLEADGIFKKRKTTVKPFEKSSVLVTDGPFRISRHPMYLGMVAIFLGIAVACGSLVTFGAPVLFAVLMQVLFMGHEERSMEQTFGQEYLEYRKRVRRWI